MKILENAYGIDQEKIKMVKAYRYVIWAVLALSYVIVFFHRFAVGVVKDDLVESFGIQLTTYANLAATYFYASLIMQIPSGILADTIGARKTVTFGVLVAGIGSILFGLAPVISMAFMGRLMVGLGVSVVLVAILKVIATWFEEEEFATMTGITIFLGNMGGILAQAPLVILVGLISWRYTFQLIGIISVILAVITYAIVRNKPEEMGFPSILQIKRQEMGLDPFVKESHENEKKDVRKNKQNIMKGLGIVLTNFRTWPPFFVVAFSMGGYIALTGAWGQSYLTEVYGFAKSTSANYMSVMILFLAISGIFIGKISDRMKSRKIPMIVVTSINMICWLILVVFIDRITQAWMIPYFAVFGASYTAFILSLACGKEVNDTDTAGVAMSVVNMGGFLGPSIIPLVMGKIISMYSGILDIQVVYQKAFVVCLVGSAFALISTLLIKETNCRNIYDV